MYGLIGEIRPIHEVVEDSVPGTLSMWLVCLHSTLLCPLLGTGRLSLHS